MSDPKRASLITVGDTKSAKNKVTKTVRLTINLDESNESKYPELNYKELLAAAVRSQRTENGKTPGLDPFSDNDEDVEMVARKFEQKYGGKSTYGKKKSRSKREDFADIGAGYDENDSFIDNTHGYDEMVPPECDTLYGGFYINCGSLEFKTVQDNQNSISDAEQPGNRRNKRRISSSSSDEESSESSSESDSQDAKDPSAIANGDVDSHKTEHRKKKNKKIDKKKAKKIRRTDSSAATSGKQTSDDNAHHGDGESADSRTSQSDSLTSKPAPSSENVATSDSSRDVETKVDVKLPAAVVQVVEELETAVSRQLIENPENTATDLLTRNEPAVLRIERILSKCCSTDSRARRVAWQRVARRLQTTRAKLLASIKNKLHTIQERPESDTSTTSTAATAAAAAVQPPGGARGGSALDVAALRPDEREAHIVDTLRRLSQLIDERKPGMISAYNAECERVQEERKKIQLASAAERGPHVEKRLPKRRFPWCARSRALLARLAALAGDKEAAAALLAARALPLFPSGFVRMPTLLRQADPSQGVSVSWVTWCPKSQALVARLESLAGDLLSKDIKASDVKRPRVYSNSTSQAVAISTQPSFSEPIQFPSSLTVTTMKTQEKSESDDPKYKLNTESVFGSIINSYSLSKETENKVDERKKDLTDIPPNIGSITITPVPNSQKAERKVNNTTMPLEKPKESLIRIKSPAALNEMVKKEKEKQKKLDKVNPSKEKRLELPLQIDTSYLPTKKVLSPKTKLEEINPKQIEAMRLAENNIPRPGLIAVHSTPTFAKPDKRPPEVKKKKDILIVSDLDPLGSPNAQQESLAVDDSSSDVEVIEEKTDKSESSDNRSDIVPSKDSVSEKKANSVKPMSLSLNKDRDGHKKAEQLDEETKELFDIVNSSIRELEHSQEPTKLNHNSYGDSVTNNAKHKMSSKEGLNQRHSIFGKAFRRTNSYEQY